MAMPDRTGGCEDQRRLLQAVVVCAAAWCVGPALVAAEQNPAATPVKKLIQLGGDGPDTVFFRQHIGEIEKPPFDGCVFHVRARDSQGKQDNFTWLCWDRRAFSAAELEPALDDLRATTFRRLATKKRRS